MRARTDRSGRAHVTRDTHQAALSRHDDLAKRLAALKAMFVQSAAGMRLERGAVTLTGVSPATLYFSDRPQRVAGHLSSARFVELWQSGANSFAADPPNAVLAFFGDDTGLPEDATVTLRSPHLVGNELTYDVEVIEGELPDRAAGCSLFIDPAGAVVDVEGYRQREEAREELDRAHFMGEIAALAAGTLSRTELAQRALETMGRWTGAFAGAIYEIDVEESIMRALATIGPEEFVAPFREAPLDDVYVVAKVALRDEVLTHETDAPSRRGLKRAEPTGLAEMGRVSVPIKAAGGVIGCFALVFPSQQHVEERDLELYRAIADQLGVALENAHLYEAEVAAEGEAKSQLERADVLLRAAGTAAHLIDLDSMLDALADLLQQSCRHSRILLELWDEVRGQVEIAVSRGPGAVSGRRFDFDQISAASQQVIRTRTTTLIDYAQARMPARQRAYVDEHTFRLMLVVPMVYRERLIGLITVDEPGERIPFGHDEIQLVEAIAAQAAAAIENARLFRHEQRIATTLQEYLLRPLPKVVGLDIGWVSQAAFAPELVGGDFSDVFLLGDGLVGVLIGDVAGKGLRAAGLTETVRATIRAFAVVDSAPAFVLGKTNEVMLGFGIDDPLVTAFLCVLNLQTGFTLYASAGHPPPVRVGPDTCELLATDHGPPLGAFPAVYGQRRWPLGLDDYLVLYTDGVTEARAGTELFGEDRLLRAACRYRGRPAQEVAVGVAQAANDFSDRLRDDLQVVVVRIA